MRTLLTILSLLFLNTAISQPIANAGSDQTIYLTSTSTITLNGTSSTGTGLSYQWREVSTDYSSGATITNANTATATVSPLPQGVFYFELQVTDNVDRVSVDTVAVIVNYATAPGTLLRSMAQTAWHNTEFIDTLNDRSGDTSNTLDQEVYHTISFPDGLGNEIFFDRNRKPDEWIDAQRGKFYSRVEDGYDWNNNGYGRAEMSFGSGYNFDTTKIYCMEWKGYFPQAFPSDMTINQTVATFMQIHANSDAQHVFGTQIVNTGSGVNFVLDADGSLHTLCGVDSFVNKTHTVRVTFKEGTPGFYKVEVDGVQKYYNNSSVIGGLPRGQDYPKIATLYDYGNALVDPTNSTRGRTFSMVTEDFSIYDVSTNIPPTASAGSDQIISLPTNSVTLTGSGTDADGTISSYAWTKEVGGTATITSPTSATTTVTGLSAGEYRFRLTVTDNNGATGSDTVHVRVNNPPTANAGTDQTITLPTNSVTLSGSGTDTDGTITSYSWSKISGGTATITSPTSASTTITGLVAGTYVFQLTVTDNNGSTGTDTVQITVKSLSNYFITHGNKIYINK
jgi:hypothetical protein